MWLAFAALAAKPAEELIQTKVATSTATVEGLRDAGPIQRLQMLTEGPAVDGPNGSGGKMHMIRPSSDPAIPWTALLIGLWIPNFFYWGLNQYIMQRTLGSKSLAEGQKGIVLAAALKLLIPFVVVIPGILAFHLFSADLLAKASQKNEPVLSALRQGTEMAIPFSQEFAGIDSATSREVIAHNAARVGGTFTAPAADAPAQDLFAANQELLAAAAAKKIPSGSMLAAYDYDAAFPTLLKNLLKPGITWFVLAAIFGAVVSSLASMLNSASTIATLDLYNKVRKQASQRELVGVGRAFVVLFIAIACVIAPSLGRPEFGGIFTFIQEFQGFISPGILAVFLFGFLVPRAPRFLGWLGIILNAVLYGALKWFVPELAFLNRMALCMGITVAVLGILTFLFPLKSPAELPVNNQIELLPSKSAKIWGIGVCIVTVALYVIFW
jgi:SSS family solute:Na+ symporter